MLDYQNVKKKQWMSDNITRQCINTKLDCIQSLAPITFKSVIKIPCEDWIMTDRRFVQQTQRYVKLVGIQDPETATGVARALL